MKLMKHITIALVLCAIPAMAFGQIVSCEDCTHDVSVYMGEGGLVATADGAEKVTWVASCGGVTRSGDLTADDDGMVAALFTMDNGLACSSDDGSFQIGPVMDGGWYWITDDMNSAVGGLVAKDVLKNATTDIASAGSGVTMTKGSGAVYLKETASGRVGILPNILPEPPTAPTRKCGFSGSGTSASEAKPIQTECALGDGKTMVLMTSTNGITGATVQIADKGSISRPAGSGEVVLVADLWGNGSGHYVASHSTDNHGVTALRGQPGLGLTAARAGARYSNVTYAVNVSTGGPGTGADVSVDGDGAGDARGVSWTQAAGAATVTVKADSAVCSKTASYATTVTLTANMPAGETGADQVVPSIERNADTNKVGSASFTIMCPSASPSTGVELVPENPFPVE